MHLNSIDILTTQARLRRELSEWERTKNIYPCVEAVPLESNICEWHCNIVANDGVFIGLAFHIIIKFPENYPLTEPSVYSCNTIPHLSVSRNQHICLAAVLGNGSSYYHNQWTPAYGVVSILKGLKSYLFEKRECDASNYRDSNMANTNHNFSKESLKLLHENVTKFKCDSCGHCYEKPYPVPPCIMFIKKDCNYLHINNIINQNNLSCMCKDILDIFGNDS